MAAAFMVWIAKHGSPRQAANRANIPAEEQGWKTSRKK
jgi:hypothetical protein